MIVVLSTGVGIDKFVGGGTEEECGVKDSADRSAVAERLATASLDLERRPFGSCSFVHSCPPLFAGAIRLLWTLLLLLLPLPSSMLSLRLRRHM